MEHRPWSAEPGPEVAPADHWERRYNDRERVWSGQVNAVLADVAAHLDPGTALDLGCGEGGDVLWLAEHDWTATGVDISATAVERARSAARTAGVTDRARFVAANLADLVDGDLADIGRFDLVTASFLHSTVELPRGEILRAAADRVAPGGHLLVTSHADAPPWTHADDGHAHHSLSPAEEIETLGLDHEAWQTVLAETRTRTTTGPDGAPATLDDTVVLLRRR